MGACGGPTSSKHQLSIHIIPAAGQACGATSSVSGESGQTARPVASENSQTLSRRKKRALPLICLAVKDKIIPVISTMTDPSVCWKLLESLYESRSVSRRLLLVARFRPGTSTTSGQKENNLIG